MAPELEDKGGLYLENCTISKLAETREKIYTDQFGYLAYAVDPDNAKKLWELSEKLISQILN